jgi:hypothetical protein
MKPLIAAAALLGVAALAVPRVRTRLAFLVARAGRATNVRVVPAPDRR